MPKTNIFIDDAVTSAELNAIKANQNLLNKVTSDIDCNAFMTSPTTYADPWQIVFLAGRDTIWTQNHEYGTSADDINSILSYINDIESWQTTYEPIINNTKSIADALTTFVGASPVDERVQNIVNDQPDPETTIVDAIKNLVDYVDNKDSENDGEINGIKDRVSALEQVGYTVASSSSYITIDTEQSHDSLTYYNITTNDIASATAVNSEISSLSERINDLTDSSRVTIEAGSSVDSDANARVNVISAPITGGGTAYTAYLIDVASKTELNKTNTELERVGSYLEGLVTTYNGEDTTHSTVASYVSTAINQAIDEVNNDAAALEERVETAEGDINQLQSDVADLTVAYVVTAYQGAENKTGQSISLAHGGAFTLKQGGHDIATIHLPLDMVVKSGTVITATSEDVTTYASDNLTEGHHYIKLIVQNDEDSPLFVDTTDLVDIYTVDNSDTVDMSIDNNNKITAAINSTYTGYILNAINKVELATNETEGHVTLSYTKTDGTTGSSDVDLSSKFATKSQGDLADTALQGVTINGQTLTKDSNSYVLDGDNIYVSYSAEGGTATTGTINQAIAEIEDKLSHTSAAAVTSVNGTGAIFAGTGTGTYNGDVTITINGSTVKSSSIPEGAYAIANDQTIDANLAALDNKAEVNKDAIAANAAEIQAIKNAINWTIIGSQS